MGSLIGPLRLLFVLIAAIAAVDKVVGAIQAWRQYRLWQERDPSAADAYLTFAQVDSVLAGFSVGVAALVWWLLRPVPRKPPGGAAA